MRINYQCAGAGLIWLFLTATFSLHEIRAEEFDRVFEDWHLDFEKFLKSKENGLGVVHSTDFEKIQNFTSYVNIIKIKDSDIEIKMLEKMGEYPYTPERLYLAFAFCERRDWKWKEVLKHYGNQAGKFGLPDALRKKLAGSHEEAEFRGQTKILDKHRILIRPSNTR